MSEMSGTARSPRTGWRRARYSLALRVKLCKMSGESETARVTSSSRFGLHSDQSAEQAQHPQRVMTPTLPSTTCSGQPFRAPAPVFCARGSGMTQPSLVMRRPWVNRSRATGQRRALSTRAIATAIRGWCAERVAAAAADAGYPAREVFYLIPRRQPTAGGS